MTRSLIVAATSLTLVLGCESASEEPAGRQESAQADADASNAADGDVPAAPLVCTVGSSGRCEGDESGEARCCSFKGRAYSPVAECVDEVAEPLGCYVDPTGQCEVDAAIGCFVRLSDNAVFATISTYELLSNEYAGAGIAPCDSELAAVVPSAPHCTETE